jgi:hypothetical protein
MKSMEQKNHVKYLYHKIECSICGKKATVKIDKKTRKILGDFYFFNKFNINSDKTDKFFWAAKNQYDKNGKFIGIDMDNMVKVPNKSYDPNVKKKMIELWECKYHSNEED